MTTTTAEWPWPDELDALVASPEHHSLIFENDSVRVLDVHIPAGERTAVHTHRLPGVLITLSRSDIVRRDVDGVVQYDSRRDAVSPDAAHWAAPFLPHTLENVGDRPLRVIAVEVKG